MQKQKINTVFDLKRHATERKKDRVYDTIVSAHDTLCKCQDKNVRKVENNYVQEIS